MLRSSEPISSLLDFVDSAFVTPFAVSASSAWGAWTVKREDPISDEELAVLSSRAAAPVLTGYIMDSDCAVIEGLGSESGFWRTCLGRDAMSAYMEESETDVDSWFLSPSESVQVSRTWAGEAGLRASAEKLSEVFQVQPDPFVEEVFTDLIAALGVPNLRSQ